MNINLQTAITVGKSLAIKREKGDDETEVICAHLKFTDLFLRREQVNALCGMRPGWAETAFFDELGAPFGLWSLVLRRAEFAVTGSISGPDDHGLVFTEATIDGVEITLTSQGAVLAGQVSWLVAGDEAGDAEPLLGRICQAKLTLTDGGQMDMLRTAGTVNAALSATKRFVQHVESMGCDVTISHLGADGKQTDSVTIKGKRNRPNEGLA